MKKFVCTVCGYVYEGEAAPAECPICHAPASKFVEQSEDMTFADEHHVGVAKDVDPRILEGLRQNFTGECSEVGMYLAMSRQADREGYPEIAEAYKRYAFEEAEHAAKFAELLGEVLTDSTRNGVGCLLASSFISFSLRIKLLITQPFLYRIDRYSFTLKKTEQAAW